MHSTKWPPPSTSHTFNLKRSQYLRSGVTLTTYDMLHTRVETFYFELWTRPFQSSKESGKRHSSTSRQR